MKIIYAFLILREVFKRCKKYIKFPNLIYKTLMKNIKALKMAS